MGAERPQELSHICLSSPTNATPPVRFQQYRICAETADDTIPQSIYFSISLINIFAKLAHSYLQLCLTLNF